MANVKISAMSANLADVTATDEFGINKAGVSKKVTGAEVVNATLMAAAGGVMDTDFSSANSILLATTANTPVVHAIAASRLFGRKATGDAGSLTAAEVLVILGIEAGSTADQTNAEIKTAYEANADTNAFDDAEQSKLAGVAASANNYTHPNHSGDVTSVNDGAQTIAAGVVTLAKMANVATSRIFGRVTAATGVPEALTAAQVLTLLGVETAATADQTDAEIKTAYENNADTNEFSDAEQTKLSGIATSADVSIGKKTLFIEGDHFVPTTTAGASGIRSDEKPTNDIMARGMDFADGSTTKAQARFYLPKSYDAATITYRLIWLNGTSGNVRWAVRIRSLSDDQSLDSPLGTAVIQDLVAGSAVDDVNIGAESGALTIAGAGGEEYALLEVSREGGHANDTMSGTATLIGIVFLYNTNAGTDA